MTSQDESYRKIRELIGTLLNITCECSESINEETREELNQTMGEVFEDCRDEDNMIDLIEMTYMLANGLAYILKQLTDGPDLREECQQKQNSKLVH